MAIGNQTPNTSKDTGTKPVSFGVESEVKIERDEVLETLNPRQRKFLENYLLNDEMRGNATQSYLDAYGYDLMDYPDDDGVCDDEGKQVTRSSREKAYDMCATNASLLMRNHKIQEAKTAILNANMTEAIVDSKMFWHILYGKGEHSIQAIREFNRLKGRIKEKLELSGDAAIQDFYSKILKRNDDSMKKE